jgi:hypothetical protein
MFMPDLNIEIAAYRAQLFDLERSHHGKWVVFHGPNNLGLFDTFDDAAKEAVRLFGRGPYLIRKIGAPPISLPVCVLQRQKDDRSELRL